MDTSDTIAFWGVVIAIIAVVLSFCQLVIGYWLSHYAAEIAQNQERLARTQIGNTITSRMLEIDRMILEHPEVWVELMNHSSDRYEQDEPATHYFDPRNKEVEKRLRIKAIIYYQLNFYDEMFVSIAGNERLSHEFEFKNWKTYMSRRLAHPLFREVLEEDKKIFGDQLVAFAESVWADVKNTKPGSRVI